MGRKLKVDIIVNRLYKKGVKIQQDYVTSRLTADLSNGRELGNKSWGYIDFLRKSGVVIKGLSDYYSKNRVKVVVNEKVKFQIRTKRSRNRDEEEERVFIESVEKPKQWHSYADIVNIPKNSDSVEMKHLEELNHFQYKQSRHGYLKNAGDKMKLKAIKKDLTFPFENETMMHWSADNQFINVSTKGTNKKPKERYQQ